MPFNTFTTSDDYSRHNRDNLPLLIQTQLSKKLKTFCCFFIAFLESKLNLQHFEKNWTSKCKYFWNQWFQNLVTETYKSFVSEKPFSFKRVKLENKKKNKKNSRTINNGTTLNRAEQPWNEKAELFGNNLNLVHWLKDSGMKTNKILNNHLF